MHIAKARSSFSVLVCVPPPYLKYLSPFSLLIFTCSSISSLKFSLKLSSSLLTFPISTYFCATYSSGAGEQAALV